MPELPDIDLYIDRIRERTNGATLDEIRIRNPFLLRSVTPPLAEVCGRKAVTSERIGKRIAIGLEDEYWLVLHLMIAGRLQWSDTRARLGGRNVLAAFDFSTGSLLLTEAGSKKRASLHAVRGDVQLRMHDPGGLEPLECDFGAFSRQLAKQNRTLKRALTDPRLFSGIGNAYSDEILHAARLSPTRLTSQLGHAETKMLFDAVQTVLTLWRQRLDRQYAGRFPDKVTAFRPEMAVHGRFGKPCPECGTTIQRIRYRKNETNYCPRCQSGGRIFADRSLSRLLRDDWPGFVDD